MKKLLFMILCTTLLCACGESKPQPTEESKTLPASSLVLKGKHAKLFKLTQDTYTVKLVQNGEDWQVRVKLKMALQTPFNQIKDNKNYEREIKGPYGELLNSSDVELESLDMSGNDLENLLQDDEEDSEVTLSGKTWSYKSMDYATAKDIFDKTVAVQISGLELEPAKNATSSKLIDKETQDAMDDVKDLIELEKDLLDALF